MDKFCTQCGAPLPEGASVCPGCGAAVPPAPRKKRKWWLIVIPVVLVLAIAAALLWAPVFIRVAPSAALAKAAAKTVEDLSIRYNGSPWKMMQDAYAPEGQSRISLRLDVVGDSGSVSYDFGLSTDSLARQAQLDFLMRAGGEELDARLYLDSECASLCSDTLLAGTNFGITYETFSQDIRGNRLFSRLDEETISMLEELVKSAQTAMQQPETQEARAKPYQDLAVSFMAQMNPVVGKAPLTLDGTQRSCYTITYTATGETLADFLEQYISLIESDQSVQALQNTEQWRESLEEMRTVAQSVREEIVESSSVFYIYYNYLVNIRSVATGTEGAKTVADVFFGTDASVNDLRLSVIGEGSGGLDWVDMTLATAKTESGFGETLTVQTAGESTGNSSISYDWDPLSGSLILHITGTDSQAYTVNCNLIELDDGFALSLDNLLEVISSIPDGSIPYWINSKMPMTLTVKKGSAIEKPEFKNIDAWTEADFLEILKSFF